MLLGYIGFISSFMGIPCAFGAYVFYMTPRRERRKVE